MLVARSAACQCRAVRCRPPKMIPLGREMATGRRKMPPLCAACPRANDTNMARNGPFSGATGRLDGSLAGRELQNGRSRHPATLRHSLILAKYGQYAPKSPLLQLSGILPERPGILPDCPFWPKSPSRQGVLPGNPVQFDRKWHLVEK